MCKARIEKTAKSIEGVVKAEWDKDNKMLKLEYDSSQTSIGEVSESIAKAGHDTKYSKAEDGVYNDLPGCCQYERVQ
jgi:copper chaperone CopZ